MISKFSVAFLVLVSMIVLTGCDPPEGESAEPWVAATYIATVTASDAELIDYPVSVALDNPDISTSAPVCVDGDQPGQIEDRDGDLSVWWKISLGTNETEEYTLDIGNECVSSSYAWTENENETTFSSGGSRRVAYVHPRFDATDIEHTRKPFHHVYGPDGERRVTKGPGGLYTHHRGIFFGYNEIEVDGETFDIWHAEDGEHQQHERYIHSQEGPIFGGHTVRINWNDRDGEAFIEEDRTLRTFKVNEAILVDFSSTLNSLRGDIRLDGDRQHAGVQFRADQYVAENSEESRFLRPAAYGNIPPDEEHNEDDYVDLPWNAFQFEIEGDLYTAIYLSHQENPGDARFSERLYGRFGEFFPYDLQEDVPLTVNYQFWIKNGHDVDREVIEGLWSTYIDPPSVQLQPQAQ